jgi:hypothetical protein
MADLTAAALMRPRGMLTKGLYPEMTSEDLVIFLDTKLLEGYVAADALIEQGAQIDAAKRDSISRAWAYYQAYEAVWQRVSAAPATASIDGEASRTYLQTQIDAFEKLRDKYATEYANLTAVTAVAVVTSAQSIAVRNMFSF